MEKNFCENVWDVSSGSTPRGTPRYHLCVGWGQPRGGNRRSGGQLRGGSALGGPADRQTD